MGRVFVAFTACCPTPHLTAIGPYFNSSVFLVWDLQVSFLYGFPRELSYYSLQRFNAYPIARKNGRVCAIAGGLKWRFTYVLLT